MNAKQLLELPPDDSDIDRAEDTLKAALDKSGTLSSNLSRTEEQIE
jgi:hypothetical protein